VSWLEVYQEEVDKFRRRLAWDRYRDSIPRKIELTISLIELVMKPGLSREEAENNICALLFCQIRDEVKDLGFFSDGESQSFAVSLVRDLFSDFGYSDEQAENRLIAAFKTARKYL
jgi:hypothetical protein